MSGGGWVSAAGAIQGATEIVEEPSYSQEGVSRKPSKSVPVEGDGVAWAPKTSGVQDRVHWYLSP